MSGDGLTPWGRTLATAGCLTLLAGLALGVFPYLLFGGLLVAAALTSRLRARPRLDARRLLGAQQVRAGDALQVAWALTVDDPAEGGACTLHDPVPEPFQLEEGRNFHVLPLTRGATKRVAYSVRAPSRGAHPFGPLEAAYPDPLGAAAARRERLVPADDVVVQAAAPPLPRLRAPGAYGRTAFPAGDRAARGTRTNDFRELRPYTQGDPLKSVNWKATARASAGEMRLVVNEYEVEGKKAVWLFLDASWYTAAGSNLRTAFDELATGAMTVAQHFLDRGHRVGLTLVGGPEARLLYPEIGEVQARRFANLLTHAAPGPRENATGLRDAVRETRGWLARERPLAFVFTLPGRDPTLEEGLLALRALGSSGRNPAPVVLLTPRFPAPADAAGRLLALRERAQAEGLRRRGVTLLTWDPGPHGLATLLAKGVGP